MTLRPGWRTAGYVFGRPYIQRSMLWRTPSARFWRNLPAGFIQPCQPTLVANPPAGPGWLHEVKHDGFRILARKQGARVEVWSRRGAVFNDRFPRIAEAVAALPVDNALIDGEAVVFLPDGHSDFAALLTKSGGERAAFVALTFSRSRATISASVRSRSGERRLRNWFTTSMASGSAKPWRPRARPCSPMPASWVWRASCRSGLVAAIGAGRVATGSSA
jgi:ATP dependent DNA ligase domain